MHTSEFVLKGDILMKIEKLTREIALANGDCLLELAAQVPQVIYTKEYILADADENRLFHRKWYCSLAALHDDRIVGFILGYEREKENNDQYPENSMYINLLAVDKEYQNMGLGKLVLKTFLEQNNRFAVLKGDVIFTIQTNSADWNKPVIDLYKRFGFREVGEKPYDNRTDVIMRLEP